MKGVLGLRVSEFRASGFRGLKASEGFLSFQVSWF